MLNQEDPNFQEFEIICEDLTISIKKELNFKSSSSDGAARPYKPVDPEDSKVIQQLYRKNKRNP